MSKTAEWSDPSFYERTDHIERGDHVSWMVDGRRVFGFVVRRTSLNYQRAFSVREVAAGRRTISHIIVARDITKECG